jgi:predicted enzyme related to lactoylglutathione lyase
MGNPVVTWQIISKNPEGAASFYADLFEWRVLNNNALGYRMVDTCNEHGIGGGIWPGPPGAPSFVQLFAEVEDVAATVKRATAKGARVVVPPQKLPDGDEMAVLLDPDGMSFGIMHSGRE